MSRATRVMAGLILISIPTIAFGGYFLLTSLIDRAPGMRRTPSARTSSARATRMPA
jgi:hypothetical protein